MRIDQVAVQLFTVRDFMKTPSECETTFEKVRTIGYRAVQFGSLPAMPVDRLAEMLSDSGLICCSTHGTGEANMLDAPEAAVECLRQLNCPSAAYPYPDGVKLEAPEDVLALAERLNAAGRVFHEAGLVFAYHNHSVEFRRFDGRVMLDILYEETDRRYVQGEPDTYWIQYGGGDPTAWCRKLEGRLPLLHMKDYRITAQGRPAFAEIGHGNLNWTSILAAAQEAGCEWYIVEQDRCEGDPFESIRMSFEYIRDNLCS